MGETNGGTTGGTAGGSAGGTAGGSGGGGDELDARLARAEAALDRLIDAVATAAPHLPVMVSLEVGALAEEARSILARDGDDDGPIDLTSPG